MHLVQLTARAVSSVLGRNSLLIRKVRPVYESFLTSLHGGEGIPWDVNGTEFRIAAGERIRFAHRYEPEAAAFLSSRITPGMTCFDVGANVGVYVLQLANWSKPNGRVVAFEPNPGAREVLASHIAWNGIGDRVTVVPLAVSSAPGDNVLYAEGADGMSRLSQANDRLGDSTVATPVPVTSIDHWCQQHGTWPDVMLLDIEGFEIEALRGSRQTIARVKPLIVVEMHPNVWPSSNASRPEAERLFAELGIRPVPLSGQRDPLEDYGQVFLEYV
jgi:FkbM family methyltransferase